MTVDAGKVLTYLKGSTRTTPNRGRRLDRTTHGLDPVLKHVIVLPNAGANITRDGLLHVAHRSGQLDGIVVDQEPTLSDDGRVWVARVSVWRKDMGHPFTFPGRYPVGGGNRETHKRWL